MARIETNGQDKASHTELSLIVPKDQIHLVSWTFDALDGTALLRTDDASIGAVTLMLPTCRLDEAEEVLVHLERHGIEIKRGCAVTRSARPQDQEDA